MSAGLIALLTALTLTVQAAARYGFGRRVPIGDENEYLWRAQAEDPFGPSPFLRVPAMPLLARIAGGHGAETRLRDLLALLAVATTACVAASGQVAMGSAGAFAATLLFVLLPDRVILSQHIWPDALLAFWHAVTVLLLTWSLGVGPVSPWLLGAVAAAAAMTRIDGAILAPALTVVAVYLYDDLLPALPGLWLPTLAALALCTLRNARRYGTALPDTTLLFNVMVMAEEHRRAGTPAVSIDRLVLALWPQWLEASPPERVAAFGRAGGAVVRDPLKFAQGALKRTWQMLGPDVFSIDRLLDPAGGAYPELAHPLRHVLRRALRVSFPLFTALAITGAAVDPSIGLCLVPCSAAFLVACLVHARTRFRFALLPALGLAAAAGVLALLDPSRRVAAAVVTVVAAVILLCAPPRNEVAESSRVA